MSRPRRYGPATSMRLPLEDHDRMVAAAGRADKPVSVWLRDLVLDHLGPRSKRRIEPAAPSEPKPDVAKRASGEEAERRADEIAEQKACPHTKTRWTGALHICEQCNAVVKK